MNVALPEVHPSLRNSVLLGQAAQSLEQISTSVKSCLGRVKEATVSIRMAPSVASAPWDMFWIALVAAVLMIMNVLLLISVEMAHAVMLKEDLNVPVKMDLLQALCRHARTLMSVKNLVISVRSGVTIWPERLGAFAPTATH